MRIVKYTNENCKVYKWELYYWHTVIQKRDRDYHNLLATYAYTESMESHLSICGLANPSRSWPSLKNPAMKKVPPKDLARANTRDGPLPPWPWAGSGASPGSPLVGRISTLTGWYSIGLTGTRVNLTLQEEEEILNVLQTPAGPHMVWFSHICIVKCDRVTKSQY